jgi:Mannosyltransferase (PIG-V)
MTHLKNNVVQYWERLNESWRFAITAFLIARLFYFVWSWVTITIQPLAIQNFELAGEPIVSIFRLKNSEAHVYLRKVNGEVLTFQPLGTENIIDQQTGSIWEISSGAAIQGQYQGLRLSTAKTKVADIFPYFGVPTFRGALLGIWQRFDANWYLSIADHGYGSIPGDVHFPPLFPLLMRALQPIFGSAFLAGLVIAHIATLFSVKLLYDLFYQWGGKVIAKRAILFFMIFPTAFFLFSAYSEPLFLVVAILSLRAMNLHSWSWTGFWIFCAILIRLQGVALLAPMLFLMWRDRPFLRRRAQWAGMSIAGVGGLVYLYLRSKQVTESTLPFVETNLHARLVPPWQSYWYAIETVFSGNATFIDILNLVITTLFILLLIWGWKKIPLEYNIYAAFSLLIILTRIVETQPLMSMSRYALTLFPSFYALSLAGENPWLQRAILYPSALLSLYLSGQFFIWGWVA